MVCEASKADDENGAESSAQVFNTAAPATAASTPSTAQKASEDARIS